MLDALLDRSIALCDAGTGIGKTYAYLAVGAVLHRFRTSQGGPFQPILISTSSIALQNAVMGEYLPKLSAVMLSDGLIAQPLSAVIRKGKSHYVCDWRLERRLGQLDLSKKNWKAGRALLSLRERLDLDGVSHLSNYDRERVCVPRTCNCKLVAANAISLAGRRPILPDASAIIIDEAHKLPETARQMFGTTLEAGDIRGLLQSLRREKFLLAAGSLAELSAPLLRLMEQPCATEKSFTDFSRLLIAPARNLHIVQK